jgi:hypothetical protein
MTVDTIGSLNLAAQGRGDGNIAANLNDVDIEPFAAKESAVFGDIKIDGGNAAAGNRENQFLNGLGR